MKLCYFGSDYPPTGGGISTYAAEWLSSVASDPENEVTAYIFGNKDPRVETSAPNLCITTRKTKGFWKIGFEILKYIRANADADVFHALYVFPVGFWTVLWSKILRRPSIVTIYGTDVCSREGSSLTRALKRLTLRYADRVIAISEFTKGAAVKALSLEAVAENIRVVYNTVPGLAAAKSEGGGVTRDGVFAVLCVCRLVERKGIDDLIRAMALIQDQNVKLAVAGVGPEGTKFETLVKASGLETRVRFLGKVPDLAPLYASSDIVVLSSYGRVEEGDFEGLGLVLLEAQSFGKPVIGTSSGGIPEAFAPDETGLLVPERDPAALAAAIVRLRDDREMYMRMSAETGAFLERRFGRARMLGEYEQLVSEIKQDHEQ